MDYQEKNMEWSINPIAFHPGGYCSVVHGSPANSSLPPPNPLGPCTSGQKVWPSQGVSRCTDTDGRNVFITKRHLLFIRHIRHYLEHLGSEPKKYPM